MNDIKPIKNQADYQEALVHLGLLIDKNPAENTAEDSQIRVLTALIEDYENTNLPDYEADPIEAIKLRVEQLGLKDIDLVPFLGTRSRVSEILSGKRSLTVAMIRNLEEGLGIPASILVGSETDKKSKRWSPKTLKLMASRGYFGAKNRSLEPDEIIERGLIRDFFKAQLLGAPGLLRQSNYRNIANIDKYHMEAWSAKLLKEAFAIIKSENTPDYIDDKVDEAHLMSLFKLSAQPKGPLKVINELKQFGIVVVIEPHLPSTRLDGATFFTGSHVIIGLTLRYDRLDNFWFTLAHELSHVLLHREYETSVYFDNLSGNDLELDRVETEADQLGGELLIPSDEWAVSPLRFGSTPTLVNMFAQKCGVHPSVVAGRIRHDSGDWTTLGDGVNDEKIRDFFKDKIW